MNLVHHNDDQPVHPSPAHKPIRTSRRFNLVSAILAFLMWGGWAWYVNSRGPSDGGASPYVSGFTQGAGSFVITLVMVRIVAWLYHCLPVTPLRVFLPAIITVGFTGSCLATAHWIVGTPRIIQTIVPALSVAFAFNVYTGLKLQNRESAIRKANAHE